MIWRTDIQVNDFCEECGDDEHQEDIEEPLVELGRATRLRNDSRAKTLNGNHTQAANPTAYRDVDKHVLLPPPRARIEGGDGGSHNDNASVTEESGSNDKALHLLDVGHGRGLRRIQDNDNGADNAKKAADFSDQTEPLLEENGGKDGGDDDGERSEGGDEDSIGESICDEVEYLSDDHEGHAGPPPKVFEIAIAFTRYFLVFLVGLE